MKDEGQRLGFFGERLVGVQTDGQTNGHLRIAFATEKGPELILKSYFSTITKCNSIFLQARH